jgi:hypothetical protein
VEPLWDLEVRGERRRVWLRVIRGMVQDGWRDSLGVFRVNSGDAGAASSFVVFFSSGRVYIPVLENAMGTIFVLWGEIRPMGVLDVRSGTGVCQWGRSSARIGQMKPVVVKVAGSNGSRDVREKSVVRW